MSKILVTGGAGFIGSHVAKKLVEEGHDVVIVDNFNKYYSPRLKQARVDHLLQEKEKAVHKVDIADYSALEGVFSTYQLDTVCHLAAQAGVLYSMQNPHVYEVSNIKGTLNTLLLAGKHGVKNFIFASSSSVYGQSEKFPSKESDAVDRPISLYAATKVAGEVMVHAYSKIYGFNATNLRFFNVYGPWTRPDSALFIFTSQIAQGRPIKVYNKGEQEKDFTYVDDIAEGVAAAVRQPYEYEIINLGHSQPVLLNKYISLIEKELGQKAKVEFFPPQIGDVNKSFADITKAKELLGYDPRVSVEEGVKKFVNWYKKFDDDLALSSMDYSGKE